MLTLYTPVGGALCQEALNAIATYIGTSTFQTGINIVTTLAVGAVSYRYIVGKHFDILLKWVVCTYIILFVLLGVKLSVAVHDIQNPLEPYSVDNIPLGIALPSSLISNFGFGLSQLFDDIFHMPDDLDYNKTGMLFGSRVFLSATAANVTATPETSENLSKFIKQCIFSSKILASQQITQSQLRDANNLAQLYFTNASPLYRVVLNNGENLTCQQAAPIIKQALLASSQVELKRLANHMTNGDTGKYAAVLESANQYLMNVSKTGSEILMQNMLINATRQALRNDFFEHGKAANLLNYTYTSSMDKMRVAEANGFLMTAYRLPLLMTVLWILSMSLFPIIILLAFFPFYEGIYATYLKSQVFLWSWAPMFSILHFIMSFEASKYTNIWGQTTGGITFSNMNAIASVQSDLALTAGYIATCIPFIAYSITRGLASAFNTAAQFIGGVAHNLSTSEAQSVVSGNISEGNYSGWNMNYDNVSAHKHDTNRIDFHGLNTRQLANGSSYTQAANGNTIINSQSGISQLATQIHAGTRVVDSLNQSANNSIHEAKQLRASADHHLNEALNQMHALNSSNGMDMRSGAGLSHSDQDSISKDFRTMRDTVNQYNEHHDKSSQVSYDDVVRASIRSRDQAFGKFADFLTGASVSASGGRTGTSSHGTHIQEFLNSSEGKTFSESLNNVISTTKSQHLDATQSSQLGLSDQVAVNLSKAQSDSTLAAADYSDAMTYQSAANHANDQSTSIDQNLSQQFSQWAMQKYGNDALSILSGSDSKSLATQAEWSNEFFNSAVGKSAVANEVNNMIHSAKNGVMTEFNNQANNITKNSNITEQYKADKSDINNQATKHHFGSFSKQQQAELSSLMRIQQQGNLMKQSNSISENVKHHMNSGKMNVDNARALRKQDFNDKPIININVKDSKFGVGNENQIEPYELF